MQLNKFFAKKTKLLIISEFITKFFFNRLIFIVSLLLTPQIYCFSISFPVEYNNNNIHTVQIYKKGWPFSNPIIQLSSSDVLTASFDEINAGVKDYYYKFELYDANWQPSILMDMEYIDGFNQFQITDYQYSFNTTFDFVHYSIEIPATLLTRSGNYKVKIYDSPSYDNQVLSIPFCVYEPKVNIIPRVKYTSSSDYKMMQQVDFVIKHPHLQITNPHTEIKTVVIQNGRTDNMITTLKPLFVRHQELVYEHSRTNEFEGGNEFRWLDIRSTRFWPQNIESVKFFDPYYHTTLSPDAWGDRITYIYREDFNGKYYIESKEGSDANTEADYQYVHFRLPVLQPMKEGDIYILGALTDWQLNRNSKMTYNNDTQCYEATLLLKQGFYNYQYALLPHKSKQATVVPLENSFAQTENEYIIMVYYKGFNDRCDQLVGVTIANSLKNTSALPY